MGHLNACTTLPVFLFVKYVLILVFIIIFTIKMIIIFEFTFKFIMIVHIFFTIFLLCIFFIIFTIFSNKNADKSCKRNEHNAYAYKWKYSGPSDSSNGLSLIISSTKYLDIRPIFERYFNSPVGLIKREREINQKYEKGVK